MLIGIPAHPTDERLAAAQSSSEPTIALQEPQTALEPKPRGINNAKDMIIALEYAQNPETLREKRRRSRSKPKSPKTLANRVVLHRRRDLAHKPKRQGIAIDETQIGGKSRQNDERARGQNTKRDPQWPGCVDERNYRDQRRPLNARERQW
ncbi:hypothetical protein CC2G_014297 [Coprinopsis cinerea AmutBmut pab1-1]|nr:hypothetical protein CC2G_014297 [Coprinopsis cinerea AmutBmut pab1-1]